VSWKSFRSVARFFLKLSESSASAKYSHPNSIISAHVGVHRQVRWPAPLRRPSPGPQRPIPVAGASILMLIVPVFPTPIVLLFSSEQFVFNRLRFSTTLHGSACIHAIPSQQSQRTIISALQLRIKDDLSGKTYIWYARDQYWCRGAMHAFLLLWPQGGRA
jgi:hypothetical protein